MAIGMSFTLGYYIRTISERLKRAEQGIRDYLDKKTPKPKVEEPTSSFIDMDDPAYRVKYEHEQMLKKLNPKDDE